MYLLTQLSCNGLLVLVTTTGTSRFAILALGEVDVVFGAAVEGGAGVVEVVLVVVVVVVVVVDVVVDVVVLVVVVVGGTKLASIMARIFVFSLSALYVCIMDRPELVLTLTQSTIQVTWTEVALLLTYSHWLESTTRV